MPTKFQKLPNEPVVVVTLPKVYNLAAELPVLMPQYMELLNSSKTTLFWIVDARESSLSVDEIVTGASLVARGEHPLYRHPNIRQVIYVTTSEIMKLAITGMQTEAFGKLQIKLFDDLDEALAYTRKNK